MKNATSSLLLNFMRGILLLSVLLMTQLMFGLFEGSALAIPGDITSNLPNNGSPATPWMVVTRPGSNGMDAPASSALVYVPASATTATFTVEDACDNTANDSSPANNDTYFWLYASDITSISTSSPGTVVSGPIPGWWNDYIFRCDSGTNSTITVGINTARPSIVINGQSLRPLYLITTTDSAKTSYYVNRYRFNVAATTNSFVALKSFTPTSVRPAPNNAADYTGVAYSPAARGWGWSTRINFAYRCTVTNTSARKVYFYDTDYHASETVDPYWQTPSHPMTYTIEKYNRYSGAFAGYANSGATPLVNQWLTGGLDTIDPFDETLPFVMDPDYIYSMVLSGINYVNSIQIALESPATQIDALDRCGGAAPSFSCTLNSIATIEPGQTYQPQVNTVYSGGSANASVTVTVTVNGVTRTVVTTISPNTNQNINLPPPITFNTAGTFPVVTKTITAVIGSTTYGPISCGGATGVSVVAKPYFKVFNGGATVGAGFNSGSTTCTATGDGQVSAFAADTPSFHGASTEYDLRALGAVATTFYSSGRQPSALPNYKALTMANDVSSGTYGGSFGGTKCITDYYSETMKAGIDEVPGNVSNITALNAIAGSDEQIKYTSDATITGGNLGAGEKLVVYVDGDAYISGNITLATNYNSLTDIPFFALVVKGNIKIAPNVTQLDGLYIAQPDGANDGTIFTCLNADNSVPNLYNSCRTKLTFNGFVVAKNIKLLRTAGTLASGPANEASTSGNIAEVFNGTPELYMAYPAFRVDGSATELYDSVTSLPPLL